MQQPLVSILMPFKNTAAYISECLQSILDQSYPYWEVLAVNDHSTDNSLAVVQDLANKDPRISVSQNIGKGIIPALRTAYAKSQGEFITRMDSDDIMTSDKLRVLSEFLIHHGHGHVAIGQVRYFSERGISNGYEKYEKWLNELTEKGSNYLEIYKECVIPSPCWMVYREDLAACGAFDPNRYPEDYDLTFRFYERALRCIPCNQVLHLWRDYDTRTSRTSEHYAQNYFLGIKLYYFLKLHFDKNRVLTVWGAGNKGKEIAKGLLKKNISFYWLCDNPRKIGKKIYGKQMLHYSKLKELKNAQSIITVANQEAQKIIRAYLKQLGQKTMRDYYFFC